MQGEIRVPLSECQPNPELLRSVDRDSEEYQEFASSIKARGVLQPILIRPIPAEKQTGGVKYYIIEGLQRWSASNDAGFVDIPVRIINATDKEVRDAQIIANAHRVETKPKEYAQALARILQDNPMMTKQELAAQLNKSTSWLDSRLSLTRLNDDVGELVDTGKISLNNAIVLSKLTPEDQKVFEQDAMTKDAATLGAAVQQHLKEKRAARREGRPEGPVEYVPPPLLLKVDAIKASYADDNTVSTFLTTQGVKVNKDTVAAAKLAFMAVLQLDPPTYQARKAKFEAEKVEREKQAELKKLEKTKEKEKEAIAARERLEKELAGV